MECFFGTPVAPLLAVRVVSSANPEFPLAADRRDRAGHRGRPCGPGRAAGATAPARNKKNSNENRMLPGRRAERRLFADRGGAAAGDTHPGWRTAAGKRDFPESWNQNARPCGPFDLGGLFAFLKGLARRGGGPAGGGRVPGLPRAFRFCGKDAGCSPATPPPPRSAGCCKSARKRQGCRLCGQNTRRRCAFCKAVGDGCWSRPRPTRPGGLTTARIPARQERERALRKGQPCRQTRNARRERTWETG